MYKLFFVWLFLLTACQSTPEQLIYKDTLDKATGGDPAAQYTLGELYYTGTGVKVNQMLAFEWCKKSADQGYAEAQFQMGEFYLYGIKESEGGGLPIDAKQAIIWYSRAAEQGNARAQTMLGYLYSEGESVEQDIQQSFHWREKAAAQGQRSALYSLGQMYEQGVGTKQNTIKAKELYEQAAAKGSSEAKKALLFLEIAEITRAAEKGDAKAQNDLANAYLVGRGLKKDGKQALKWYTKSAEQGYAAAEHNLGYMYENANDNEQAAKWYTKSAKKNNAESQYKLALLYMSGRGVEKNPKRALSWMKKSADQNHKLAQHTIGEWYLLGNSVTKDGEKAIHWLVKAAEQGHKSAMVALAAAYSSDQFKDVVTQDYTKAYVWLVLSQQAQFNNDVKNIELKLTEEQLLAAKLQIENMKEHIKKLK